MPLYADLYRHMGVSNGFLFLRGVIIALVGLALSDNKKLNQQWNDCFASNLEGPIKIPRWDKMRAGLKQLVNT